MRTKETFVYGARNIIFAVAVALALAFTACEQPNDSETGKTLTGITLNTDSVKKAYNQNETLNLSGLIVTANYSDKTNAMVTNYTANPADDAALAAATIVTVSYTEGAVTKTDNFNVTVHDWGEWEKISDATETEDGEEIRTCGLSDDTDTRPLYATGTAGLQYDLINDNTAYRVNRGAKPRTEIPTLHIPAYWRPLDSTDYDDYKPVIEIGRDINNVPNNAFGGTGATAAGVNATLTAITFAENRQPTTIAPYAFMNCTALNELTIPESVTIGGRYAFHGCTGLTSVTISTSVDIDYDSVFAGCTKLTEVIFKEGVTSIGDSIFNGCTSLAEITIPESVKTIGSYAPCVSLLPNVSNC